MLYKILSPKNTATMIVYHPKKGFLPPQEGLFTTPRKVVYHPKKGCLPPQEGLFATPRTVVCEIPMGRVDLKRQIFLKEKTTINSIVMRYWRVETKKKSFVEATCKGVVIFCNNLLDSLVPTSIIK